MRACSHSVLRSITNDEAGKAGRVTFRGHAHSHATGPDEHAYQLDLELFGEVDEKDIKQVRSIKDGAWKALVAEQTLLADAASACHPATLGSGWGTVGCAQSRQAIHRGLCRWHIILLFALRRTGAADHRALHHASHREERAAGALAAAAQGGRQAGAKHQGKRVWGGWTSAVG